MAYKEIIEPVKRMCCESKDLIKFFDDPRLSLCKYCHSIFLYKRRSDGTGQRENFHELIFDTEKEAPQ